MGDNILSDFSKKIIDFCEKAKLDFSKSVNSYFNKLESKSASHNPEIIPKLPSKRPPTIASSKPKPVSKPSEKPRNAKKRKISSSESDTEEELEYKEAIFTKQLSTNYTKNTQKYVKTVEEEIKEIFSSESCSLMNSDSDKSSKSAETKVSCDIEELINDFKSGKDRRKLLSQIEKFVVNFSKLETKEKERVKPILAGLENLKIEQEDIQMKARMNEINAQIKKITNSLSIEEDWPRLTASLKFAVNEKDKLKITEIIRRVGDNFPNELTQSLIAELTQLLTVIKSLSETMEECETKQRVNTIIKKWNSKMSLGRPAKSLEPSQKLNQIIKEFKKSDFENPNKPSINCIDASKSVPNRSRRK